LDAIFEDLPSVMERLTQRIMPGESVETISLAQLEKYSIFTAFWGEQQAAAAIVAAVCISYTLSSLKAKLSVQRPGRSRSQAGRFLKHLPGARGAFPA
jgi:hypothetical protein